MNTVVSQGPSSFEDCKLYISARSPFARRVRLALSEHGVKYEELIFDALVEAKKERSEIAEHNPLRRVPVVKLKNGEVLYDSQAILDEFYHDWYEVKGERSPWLVRDREWRFEERRWSVLATGVCEKLIEYFFESMRPEETRDPEINQEVERIIESFFALLEPRAQEMLKEGSLGNGVVGSGHLRLTQADLDLGTALAYCSLRYSEAWTVQFPGALAYFKVLSSRPSFEKTAPPPVK